ncbi:MAG: hypothetical protein GY833_22325 [Aestuariibacter sp.]|nr:hypothetical protein [Aestuariibacter sp.]|tara:strand:+ start:7314 stop:7736 length:423 start_codon:yes stop_codon:yes gene_type:complete
MITAHTLNSSGKFDETTTTDPKLSIQADTHGKEQLMVYVDFKKVSPSASVKLTMLMSDPSVNDGKPFVMSTMNGATVVPMVIDVALAGAFRIPVPVASNERMITVQAELLDGTDDGEGNADSLSFWVSLNAYQPVSGLIQ